MDHTTSEQQAVRAARLAAQLLEPRPRPGHGVSRPPMTVPGYQFVCEIHRGGQGVVYQAIQESTGQQVAIKWLRFGVVATPAERVRLERELRALGQLRHPNIVTVHDSGIIDGQPYFVMQFVDGPPLDRFLAEHAPSRAAVITLMAEVADAVQAAHTRGVIHRDLKPANILVEGLARPIIVDFGLAKLADTESSSAALTGSGQFVGSLPWAAPEQIRGAYDEIDTRTDVYALGALLYYALSGRPPFDTCGSYPVVVERVLTTTPAPLRAIEGSISDELEWITTKCLAHEAERRYASAAELAAELRRHLNGEPVLARPPSLGYLVRKQFQRHRARSLAIAVSLTALIVGGAAATVGFVAATRQAAIASAALADAARRAEDLERVAAFQSSQLAAIDVSAMALKLKASLVAKFRSASSRSGFSPDEVEQQSQAFESLLRNANPTNAVRSLLGDEILGKAHVAIESQFADQPLVRARLLQSTADTLRSLGLLTPAERAQSSALQIRRELLGEEHADTLQSLTGMAHLLDERGRHKEAEALFSQVLEARIRVLGPDHSQSLATQRNLAGVIQSQGRFPEAEQLLSDVLLRSQRAWGDTHPSTLGAILNLSALYAEQGNYEAAERHCLTVLAERDSLGPRHEHVLRALNNLTVVYQAAQRFAEAESVLREVLSLRREQQGDDHPETVRVLQNLGSILQEQGKYDEAERCLREVLASRRRLLGDRHVDTLVSIGAIGGVLGAQNRYVEAEPYCREAWEGLSRILPEDHPYVLIAAANLGEALEEIGQVAQALHSYQKALAGLQRVMGDANPITRQVLWRMGGALQRQKRFADAEPFLLRAYEGTSPEPAVDAAQRTEALTRLVALYEAWMAAAPDAAVAEKLAQRREQVEHEHKHPQPAATRPG